MDHKHKECKAEESISEVFFYAISNNALKFSHRPRKNVEHRETQAIKY